ncbi:MAG TPA: CARDB domain-containing protein [Anaerolineae bacterium]|nr:CARDB domain-containing protein [Anaerolineae bacterium]
MMQRLAAVGLLAVVLWLVALAPMVIGSSDLPAAGAGASAPPVIDLDALYVERTPRYGWNADKNWPDVDEPVTYTLHLANKGSAAAGMFSIRWQTIDPTGTVVASSVVTQAFAGLAAGVQATPVYTAAWGDGRWRDGPYRVVVQADVTNAVNEGTFENNNAVDDFTDALSVAFVVEQEVYEWVGGQPTGRIEDVPEPYRGAANFYWLSQPAGSSPHRAGTYSWEDWAQRQIAQMNEYFYKAEDDYFGGERNRLIRVRLDQVLVVSNGSIGFGNWPPGLDMTPDLGWGFADYDPIYTGNNPEFMVVEWTLIHELSHHMGRHHSDLGAIWLTPANQQLLINTGAQAFAQRYNMRYSGDVSTTFGVAVNSGYDRGYDPYSAWGFDYQFQNRAGRDVSERMGAQNAGNGRLAPIPTSQPHYWNPYYVDESVWPGGLPDYSGNNYWIHFERPPRPQSLVLGQNGLPLSGAVVKVYRAAPVPDDERMPNSYVDESVRWSGYLKIDTSGPYTFSVVTISPVYFTLTVNSQVLVANEYAYADTNEYLDQNYPATLPAGVVPLVFEIRTNFGNDIWRNFGLLYKRPGDTLPRAIPTPALFRDAGATQPGIAGTYYDNDTFTPPAALVRTDADVAFSDMFIDDTPEFTLTTNALGLADAGSGANLLADSSSLLNRRAHMAMARIEYGGQEFFKVIDIVNVNQAFWRNPGSPEPIRLDVNPDGTHSWLPFDGASTRTVYLPVVTKNYSVLKHTR